MWTQNAAQKKGEKRARIRHAYSKIDRLEYSKKCLGDRLQVFIFGKDRLEYSKMTDLNIRK
jgi:hypothetical protein